eukprot:493003-Hanusia_phi.AAC.3
MERNVRGREEEDEGKEQQESERVERRRDGRRGSACEAGSRGDERGGKIQPVTAGARSPRLKELLLFLPPRARRSTVRRADFHQDTADGGEEERSRRGARRGAVRRRRRGGRKKRRNWEKN